MSRPVIKVEGDRYSAVFNVPEGTVRTVTGTRTIAVPVGPTYILKAIQYLLKERYNSSRSNALAFADKPLCRLVQKQQAPFKSMRKVYAQYTVRKVGEVASISDPEMKQDLLRTEGGTQRLELEGIRVPWQAEKPDAYGTDFSPTVLVSWLGELVADRGAARSRWQPDVHIQIGLCGKLSVTGREAHNLRPSALAKPKVGRIIVLNLGEISDTHRVRKSQSYEAIAVDLLRYLRGDGSRPTPERGGVLAQLSMFEEDAPKWSILAVRLNNSAVFLYVCQGTMGAFKEEGAWIVCHKEHCAPMETPELGRMLGFTGFVSAYFGCNAVHLARSSNTTELALRAVESLKSSLAWQRAAFERGFLSMLFRKDEDGWAAAPDYLRLFDELKSHLGTIRRKTRKNPENEVMEIEVEISRAVAHRTQWFMARSSVLKHWKQVNQTSEAVPDVEKLFYNLVMDWLCDEKRPEQSPVPIVSMGELKLTDRREVEDYLGIHQALEVYSKAVSETKPLNVAVFGAPGAGKSFGVTQVVKSISLAGNHAFREEELQFNLGQFKSLGDLPSALHLVRNECLSGKIPIVFFDEFDSAFEGQPFGWLKFLLAPMQDGSFYDNGANYKIGKAVFIFAGGVNRSFEELNGRMRNPGFCEAKGPDFISRLKAHLNIQGINKPEDDGDQGRYLLRRGILLHGIVRRHFGIKTEQKGWKLLHPNVAHALLSLDRFKHGVRSLESIVKMCTTRLGSPIGPSDLPPMEQMEMHVDASKLLQAVDKGPV